MNKEAVQEFEALDPRIKVIIAEHLILEVGKNILKKIRDAEQQSKKEHKARLQLTTGRRWQP